MSTTTASTTPAHLEPLALLHAAGGHLVLASGADKGAIKTGWQTQPAPLADAQRHAQRGLPVGIISTSLGLAAVDIDHNDHGYDLDTLRKAFDTKVGAAAIAAYPSRTKGHFHIWYVARSRAKKTRWAWTDKGLAGEIRAAADIQTIVYDLPALATGLPMRPMAGVATLSRLPAPPKQAAKARGVDIAGGDWSAGNRHITAAALAFRLGKIGAPDAQFDELRLVALAHGLPANEIDTVIRDQRAAGEAAAGEAFERIDHRALRGSLERLGYDWRLNVRSQRPELRNGVAGWEDQDDYAESAMRQTIADRFEVQATRGFKPLAFTKDGYGDYLRGLVHDHRVDPFLDWISSLPTWDGEERLDAMLHVLFRADSNDELGKWCSRAPLLGAIYRARNPGARLREVPVLIGGQNIGKSAMLAHLFPPSHRAQWFGDSLRLDQPPQKMLESTLGRVIVEASELGGIRRGDLEQLKSFLSRVTDNGIRLAYDARPVDQPRRFVMVGTANDAGDGVLPNDASGLSRFVPVKVFSNDRPVEPYLDEVRDQLWAEARQRVDEGDTGQLPRRLVPAQAEAAEAHRARDLVEDAVAGLSPGAHEGGVTIMALQSENDALGKVSAHRVGRALRATGWEQRKLLRGRLWFPVSE